MIINIFNIYLFCEILLFKHKFILYIYMLSSIKKVNAYSSFPVDLQANFNTQKDTLNIFTQIKDGEKIGKDSEGKYYIFSNSYVQLATRWWYEENRSNTIKYIDEDLGNYMNFLDTLMNKIEDDVLGIYKKFGIRVKEYNTDLINGLYILKKTYENQKWSYSDPKQIIAKIDSVILTLIDFKDKIDIQKEKNDKKMDTLMTINNTIKSFEV